MDLLTGRPARNMDGRLLFVLVMLANYRGGMTQTEPCQSLVEATMLEFPMCEAFGNCSGLDCRDSFNDSASFVVTKCQDPVTVDVTISTVESLGNILFQQQFEKSATISVSRGGNTITIAVMMSQEDDNLEFEVNLAYGNGNPVPVIPHVSVPLNTSECQCESLHDLASIIHSPLEHDCVVLNSSSHCDGVRCELDYVGTVYYLKLIVLSCEDPPAVEFAIEDSDLNPLYEAVFNKTGTTNFNVANPPVIFNGTLVQYNHSIDVEIIAGLQIYGEVEFFPYHKIYLDLSNCSRVPSTPPPVEPTPDTTDPTTVPPDGQIEQCQTLVTATQLHPECEAFGDCSGLTCQLQYIAGSASFVVTKCQDPVSVDFRINASSIDYQQQFDQSGSVSYNGVVIVVQMSRNDTFLDFMAYMIVEGDIAITAIPSVLVPLNTSECQCESLHDLASIIHSPLEHDCVVLNSSSHCDGVRCELDYVGTVYYLALIVLSCEDPPAVEFAIEDSDLNPLYEAVFNKTGTTNFNVANPPVIFNGTLVQYNHSIDVEIIAGLPIYGEVEFFPYHKIYLDLSNCSRVPSTPPPVEPTPDTTDPTTVPPDGQIEQCQTLVTATQLHPECEAFGDCSGLTCQLQYIAGSASFVVTKCQDPVSVDFRINASSIDYQQQFDQSGSVSYNGVEIVVQMSRNDTFLDFMAYMIVEGDIAITAIPSVLVPLNTSECQCESLHDLASIIHSPLEHDCVVLNSSSHCDGVRCELDYVGTVYYLELIVLSCEDPPAVEFAIEDSDLNPLYEAVFNKTGTTNFNVANPPVIFNGTLVQYNHSIDVEIIAGLPIYGEVEFFPYHKIYLDLSNCSRVPSTPPPVEPTPDTTDPTTVPPDGSDLTCMTLYSIATTTPEAFTCVPNESCNTLECTLKLLNTYYLIAIQLASCYDPPYMVITVTDAGGMYLQVPVVITQDTDFNVTIPAPIDTLLRFYVDSTSTAVGLQIDISVEQQTTTLLPDTSIPYVCPGQIEQCQTLVTATQLHPECEAFGDCSGLTCQLQYIAGSASFVVTKCQDPVSVDFRINASSIDYQQQFDQSGSVSYNGVEIVVQMSRNDTFLDFMAYMIVEGDIAITAIPSVLVPLNTSECACESLDNVASSIESPLEHDCQRDANCDGVRCEMDLFGRVFYIELLIDPCQDPPAVDWVIFNSDMEAIYEVTFDESGTGQFTVRGQPLPLEQIIVHHNYSMEIEAYLTVLLLGRIHFLPRQTIILDRTKCDMPITLPPLVTTDTPPPPTIVTPPSSASLTCLALFEVADDASSEPFLCSVVGDCGGLQCRLDLLSSVYTIDIDVEACTNPPETSVTVFGASGEKLWNSTTATGSLSATVEVSEPPGSQLLFQINGSLENAVGLKVELEVQWPSQQTDTLIPYTVIPYDCPAVVEEQESLSEQGRIAIGLTVSILGLLLIAVMVVIAVVACVVYSRRRHRGHFEFKSFGELKKEEEESEADENVYTTSPDSDP